MPEGLDYTKAGQVATFVMTPGKVVASVQGRAPRPYETAIEVATLSAADWDRIVATMASEAIWAAKLLTGELPPSVEMVFAGIGRSLLPGPRDIVASCSCADRLAHPDVPCKHLVAVAGLLAERMELDPLLAFTLRGVDGQRLLERLQEARAIATRGTSTAHAFPAIVESIPAPPPSQSCLRDFWRPGVRIGELDRLDEDERVPHALLRRLGPSPFQAATRTAADVGPRHGRTVPTSPTEEPPPISRFPLVGLLASIYDAVAVAANELRDGVAEATPPPPDDAGK